MDKDGKFPSQTRSVQAGDAMPNMGSLPLKDVLRVAVKNADPSMDQKWKWTRYFRCSRFG